MTATLADAAVAGIGPGFLDPDLAEVGDWMPARYTRSLTGTEEFTTDADRLLAVVAVVWRTPEVEEFLADPWQVWLLRHLLETYPPDWHDPELRGQLRFRQSVTSVARQNGKSVLAALLAFYFLTMHVRGPRVVGVASVERQAKVVYDRVRHVIGTRKDPNPRAPQLAEQILATESRGVKWRDGSGIYQTLPADEDAAQGEPISGCVYDELHLGLPGLWSAIKKGQRARRNSMLVGITTAGDDDSDLLISLYQEGADAIAYTEACLEAGEFTGGDDERFGFFVWEAPSDELTEAGLLAASPAIATGRIPLSTAAADARKEWKLPKDRTGVTGKERVIRYDLNRFLQGSVHSWASLSAWRDTAVDLEALEHAPRGVVYTLERTDGAEWVSVVATSKHPAGRVVTELVAVLAEPDLDLLEEVCLELHRVTPGAAFALLRSRLKALGERLVEAGLEVWFLNAGEEAEAAVTARATIARRALEHPGDALLTIQNTQARKRDSGESWRISRSLSTGDVDAVIATAIGVYVADARGERAPQMF